MPLQSCTIWPVPQALSLSTQAEGTPPYILTVFPGCLALWLPGSSPVQLFLAVASQASMQPDAAETMTSAGLHSYSLALTRHSYSLVCFALIHSFGCHLRPHYTYSHHLLYWFALTQFGWHLRPCYSRLDHYLYWFARTRGGTHTAVTLTVRTRAVWLAPQASLQQRRPLPLLVCACTGSQPGKAAQATGKLVIFCPRVWSHSSGVLAAASSSWHLCEAMQSRTTSQQTGASLAP
eukprot:1133181-Pelagomonas_calceolata.AAC.3